MGDVFVRDPKQGIARLRPAAFILVHLADGIDFFKDALGLLDDVLDVVLLLQVRRHEQRNVTLRLSVIPLSHPGQQVLNRRYFFVAIWKHNQHSTGSGSSEMSYTVRSKSFSFT